MLAAQALIPLAVEQILSVDTWEAGPVVVLALLIGVLVACGYMLEREAHTIASRVGHLMRRTIFAHVVRSRVLHQEGLVRTSIVSRHTSDVDGVTDAVASTLDSGLPGVFRLILSLILLSVIDWRAGLAMTGATLVFLLIRLGVGRGLVRVDRARLDARSRVSENIDEAISAARPVRGLRLGIWVQDRVAAASKVLEVKSRAQGSYLAQLSTAARAAGLIGLFVVVTFAVVVGGTNLASVAAALLYVEAVVRSLEALPPWVRELQLAIVSRQRIDQILNAPADADRPTASPEPANLDDALTRVDRIPLVAVVTTPDIDVDDVLALVGRRGDRIHVTQEPLAFNLPIADHVRAQRPDMTDDEIWQILEIVGLPVAGADGGAPLGPGGSALTTAERQRLTLAIALASNPESLLVGPIQPVRDADGALQLIGRLSRSGPRFLAVAAASPQVAQAADSVLFVDAHQAVVGTHAELLIGNPDYSGVWERHLNPDQVDLSSLGLGDDAASSMHARLVMEDYAAGEIVYRQGDPADRVIFIVAGRLEILAPGEDGSLRRVAVLGPGNHCGDLRLTVGERRAETVRCLEGAVVRSLSREAISGGMMGLLDRTPAERRIVSALLRTGPGTADELRERLPDLDAPDFNAALALLDRDGAVTIDGGVVSASQGRSRRTGVSDILDRISSPD